VFDPVREDVIALLLNDSRRYFILTIGQEGHHRQGLIKENYSI
jgi:hypothetical protein